MVCVYAVHYWQYTALCLFLELFWAHPVLTLRGGPCGVGPKKFRAGPCLVEPPVDPRGTCTCFVFYFLNINNVLWWYSVYTIDYYWHVFVRCTCTVFRIRCVFFDKNKEERFFLLILFISFFYESFYVFYMDRQNVLYEFYTRFIFQVLFPKFLY